LNESWQQEESAAERFLRGAVAADPGMVTQVLCAAVRSAPAEADSLTALALRLVPQARDAILAVASAAAVEDEGELTRSRA